MTSAGPVAATGPTASHAPSILHAVYASYKFALASFHVAWWAVSAAVTLYSTPAALGSIAVAMTLQLIRRVTGFAIPTSPWGFAMAAGKWTARYAVGWAWRAVVGGSEMKAGPGGAAAAASA
ncbi:hypothetical protein AMAG_15729 [Allomyces macrogynus ATCC 38327]|uniref:Uncharacterized protein n=1 Tax=Allomyces macrogynus (strain ATCC 38327) TaxID=578462 RepID=A0A0L0T9Q0_ALLM3|nr:hypothetical protein AMAG_15729 [Allomyces macrogynus ATCC 38327]|eukprot:KNE71513.1 hypothetical protein AMAG_15729 [Allomyces macrogynus ATCC 38327]